MTPIQITALAGVVLSILFEYVPGLHNWYNALTDTKQRLVMLGVLFVTVAGAFGLSCAKWLTAFPCTQQGVKDAVFAFVIALAANQGTYTILPKKDK